MTRRGRLRDELRRLANSPVTVLDAARAQRLEHRVLGAARPRELEMVEAEPVDTPRASRRRAAVVAFAAACVLAVVVIASLDRAGSPDRIVSMSGDVDVVLPDGSVVDGTARMEVPDGAILRLGEDGAAEVDGITIAGAGDYLVTADGVTLLTSEPPAPIPPAATGGDERSSLPAEPPVVVTRPRPTALDSSSTLVRPSTTQRAPATTAVVRPTTTGSETATTGVRPTTSQRDAPAPPIGSLEPRQTVPSTPTSTAPSTIAPPSRSEPSGSGPAPLDVTIRPGERNVVFAWRAVPGAVGYVVAALPAVADGESSWPPAPGVELTDLPAGTLQHSVARPTDGAWSYRIAAVARDGRTLALSRVFTIES
jgi:hypothetical protein